MDLVGDKGGPAKNLSFVGAAARSRRMSRGQTVVEPLTSADSEHKRVVVQPAAGPEDDGVTLDDVAGLIFDGHATSSGSAREAFRMLGPTDDGKLPLAKLLSVIGHIPYVGMRFGQLGGEVDEKALETLFGLTAETPYITEQQWVSMARIEFPTRPRPGSSSAPQRAASLSPVKAVEQIHPL
eukprot:m51a1_g5807 hypothetical protein (182) ;mRNA; f:138073-138673